LINARAALGSAEGTASNVSSKMATSTAPSNAVFCRRVRLLNHPAPLLGSPDHTIIWSYIRLTDLNPQSQSAFIFAPDGYDEPLNPLVDVSTIDTSIELFAKKQALAIVATPTATAGLLWYDGEANCCGFDEQAT
jgi:hypothetical protein